MIASFGKAARKHLKFFNKFSNHFNVIPDRTVCAVALPPKQHAKRDHKFEV